MSIAILNFFNFLLIKYKTISSNGVMLLVKYYYLPTPALSGSGAHFKNSFFLKMMGVISACLKTSTPFDVSKIN
jgi:hypothetical protein